MDLQKEFFYREVSPEDFKRDHSKLWVEKKKKLDKVLNIDYKSQLEQDINGRYKIKNLNKPLLSPSRVLKLHSEYNMYGIPPFVLEKARERGKRLMENIEYFFNNKLNDISQMEFLEGDKPYFYAVIQWLLNVNGKILAVEKLVHNGICMGIMDMIVKIQGKYYMVEIKTRSNHEIRRSDIFQCYWYYCLTHRIPTLLLIVDKNHVTKCYKINSRYNIRKFKSFINNLKPWIPIDLVTHCKIE